MSARLPSDCTTARPCGWPGCGVCDAPPADPGQLLGEALAVTRALLESDGPCPYCHTDGYAAQTCADEHADDCALWRFYLDATRFLRGVP